VHENEIAHPRESAEILVLVENKKYLLTVNPVPKTRQEILSGLARFPCIFWKFVSATSILAGFPVKKIYFSEIEINT
jgi:hypothetical protein